tara:strand:- start:152 stop:478 length:327 start_codon:yes stop_codon:yes gene_type:complete
MVNPEDKWKESAVLIYVVITIITLSFFVLAFAWGIINNPSMRLRLKKILCCCLHDSLNKYDSIVQDDAEGHELIKQEDKSKKEEITFEIDEKEEEEIEINLGINDDAI